MMIVIRMISLKDNDQDDYCFYHDYIIMMVYVFDPPSGYSLKMRMMRMILLDLK